MSQEDERDLRVRALLDPLVDRWDPQGDPSAAAARGGRRRALRGAVAVLTVVVFVGVVAWGASTMGRDTESAPPAQSRVVGDREYLVDGDVTTLVDHGDGFEITYPDGWIAADERINDWVSSPREILALATYPLRPGGEAVTDGQVPSNAMDDLGRSDAFIWVNDGGSADGRTPERPIASAPATVCNSGGDLCPDPDGRSLGIDGVRAWWVYFEDHGRLLYVFVAMGEDRFQDPVRAQEVWGVLDTLLVEPR